MVFEGHNIHTSAGYPAVCIDGKSKHIHRIIWERHNGPVPSGFVIHHVDGNRWNWDISNLVILSRAQHRNEHADIVHRKGVPIVAFKNEAIITFPSIESAAAACGTYPSNIRRILNGTQHKANGWVFLKAGD